MLIENQLERTDHNDAETRRESQEMEREYRILARHLVQRDEELLEEHAELHREYRKTGELGQENDTFWRRYAVFGFRRDWSMAGQPRVVGSA